MNPYIYLLILLLIAILLIVIIRREPYSMTLGNYGMSEPEVCKEDAPVDSTCRACSTNCPDPTNCYECKRKTMCSQTYPTLRDIPSKKYAICNACHLPCNDPERCFLCKQKMNLDGVL